MDTQNYLTIKDAAEIKECSRNTIYQLIERGEINVLKIADRRYVVKDDKFAQANVAPRGVPFNKLEQRIESLEQKLELIENKNRQLEERLAPAGRQSPRYQSQKARWN